MKKTGQWDLLEYPYIYCNILYFDLQISVRTLTLQFAEFRWIA